MSTDEIIAKLREIGAVVFLRKEYIFIGIGGICATGQTFPEAIEHWCREAEKKMP